MLMNNLLPIHNCVQVAFDNENLLKLNSSLHKENKILLEQVESYKRYLNNNELNRMIDVSTQANIHLSYFCDQVIDDLFFRYCYLKKN
jgi:hypothetical protein